MKRILLKLIPVFLALSALIMILPVAGTVILSFYSKQEISLSFFSSDPIKLGFGPSPFTLEQYADVLFLDRSYILLFWRSLMIAIPAALGQAFVAFVTGYVFGRIPFRLKKALLAVYVAVMLMPFSVTLLSNYIIIRDIGLLNTHTALVLPAIFSPLGTLIVAAYFRGLPQEPFDAVMLETSSVLRMLAHIALPLSLPAVGAAAALSFADAWNMVEQPKALMTDIYARPFAFLLSEIQARQNTLSFAGAMLYLLPAMLLFMFMERALAEQLEATNAHE